MIHLYPHGQHGHTKLNWRETAHIFERGGAGSNPESLFEFHDLKIFNDHRLKPLQPFEAQVLRNTDVLLYVINGKLQVEFQDRPTVTIEPFSGALIQTGSGCEFRYTNVLFKEQTRFIEIWVRDRKSKKATEVLPISTRPVVQEVVSLLPRKISDSGLVSWRPWIGLVDQDKILSHKIGSDKDSKQWLQLATGELELNGKKLEEGDGAAIQDEEMLNASAIKPSLFFLVQLG